MSRNFAATASDKIVFGDIFSFSATTAWSVGGFARFENFSGDQRSIITKYGTDPDER